MNYSKSFRRFVLVCFGQRFSGNFKSGPYEVKFFKSLSACISKLDDLRSNDVMKFIKVNFYEEKSYFDTLHLYYENEFTSSFEIMELHEFIIAYPELIEEILKEDHKNNFF